MNVYPVWFWIFSSTSFNGDDENFPVTVWAPQTVLMQNIIAARMTAIKDFRLFIFALCYFMSMVYVFPDTVTVIGTVSETALRIVSSDASLENDT